MVSGNSELCRRCEASKKILDDLGLHQLLLKQATRYSASGQTSSLLDLVMTNNSPSISDMRVLPPIADHCPVLFQLTTTIRPQRTRTHVTSVYDYAATDFRALRYHLLSLPLYECVQGATSPDSARQVWESYFIAAVAKYVPLKLKQKQEHKKNRRPWFTSHHHKLWKTRNRLFKRAKATGRPEDWTLYRFSRNAFTSSLRTSQKHYFRQLGFDLLKKRQSATWWNQAKSLCNINRPKQCIPALLDDNGVHVEEETGKADLLCSHFAAQCSLHHNIDTNKLDNALPMPADPF